MADQDTTISILKDLRDHCAFVSARFGTDHERVVATGSQPYAEDGTFTADEYVKSRTEKYMGTWVVPKIDRLIERENMNPNIYRKIGHEDGLDLHQTWQDGCLVAEEENERLRAILAECKDKAFIRKFPGDEQLFKAIETALNQPSDKGTAGK